MHSSTFIKFFLFFGSYFFLFFLFVSSWESHDWVLRHGLVPIARKGQIVGFQCYDPVIFKWSQFDQLLQIGDTSIYSYFCRMQRKLNAVRMRAVAWSTMSWSYGRDGMAVKDSKQSMNLILTSLMTQARASVRCILRQHLIYRFHLRKVLFLMLVSMWSLKCAFDFVEWTLICNVNAILRLTLLLDWRLLGVVSGQLEETIMCFK